MRRLSLLCLLVPAAAAAGTPPTWRATNLTEVARFHGSIAMNDHGQVVGDVALQLQAAIWSSSSGLRNLPNTPSPYAYGDPLRINNQGEIIMGVTRQGEDWILAYSETLGYREYPASGQDIVGVVALNDSGDVLVRTGQSFAPTGFWNLRTNQTTNLPAGYAVRSMSGEYLSVFSASEQRYGTLRSGAFTPLQLPTGVTQISSFQITTSGRSYVSRFQSGTGFDDMFFDEFGALTLMRRRRVTDVWQGYSNGDVLFGGQTVNGSQSHYTPLLWSSEWGYVNPLDHAIGAAVSGERLAVRAMNSRHQMIVQASSASGDFQAYYFLEPVPEPATLAILGLGLVPFLRRRVGRGPR